MTAIHADGRAPSNAVIDGRFGLRACIVNFRTEADDVERLLAVAAELAGAVRWGAQACGSFFAPRLAPGPRAAARPGRCPRPAPRRGRR